MELAIGQVWSWYWDRYVAGIGIGIELAMGQVWSWHWGRYWSRYGASNRADVELVLGQVLG